MVHAQLVAAVRLGGSSMIWTVGCKHLSRATSSRKTLKNFFTNTQTKHVTHVTSKANIVECVDIQFKTNKKR